MSKFILASVLSLFASSVALADVQSDTIPTSQLAVSYQVAPAAAGSTQVQALVTMSSVAVVNGQAVVTDLTQSTDDVVTFSNGQTSITYNPANSDANALPYVAGATYSVSFKRFNGETYSNSAVMPATATILTPSQNEVFKNSDTISLTWTTPTGAEYATFLTTANCGEFDTNDINYNSTYTAATIAANAVSSCTKAVDIQFYPTYLNVGTGYGAFAVASMSEVSFSYGAPSTLVETPVSLKGVRLDHLLRKALRSKNHTVRLP